MMGPAQPARRVAREHLPDLFGNYPADGPAAMPEDGDSRVVARLLGIWDEARDGDRAMPDPEKVSQEFLDTLWPHLFMIDLRTIDASDDAGPHGVLIRVGGLMPDHPAVRTGMADARGLKALPRPLWRQLTPVMDAVITERAPLSRSGKLEATDGGALFFRSAILPMSDDAQRVSHLLGAISCKWRAAA